MFNSVLKNEPSQLTLDDFFLCMVVSILLGILIAYTHMYQNNCTKNFMFALIGLPTLVHTIILLINGNLGTGIAVLGAFNLVRFRSAQGNSRDIFSIFWATSIGLATGTGYIVYALFVSSIVAAIQVIIFTLPIKNKHTVFNTEKTIKLKVSKSLFLSSIIEEKIAEYTENCNLKKVKINKETCSLHYIVKVKTSMLEKEVVRTIMDHPEVISITVGMDKSNKLL